MRYVLAGVIGFLLTSSVATSKYRTISKPWQSEILSVTRELDRKITEQARRIDELEELLNEEIAYRTDEPKTDWEYQRLFAIMRSEHGLQRAAHQTILSRLNRGEAPSSIKPRRNK